MNSHPHCESCLCTGECFYAARVKVKEGLRGTCVVNPSHLSKLLANVYLTSNEQQPHRAILR